MHLDRLRPHPRSSGVSGCAAGTRLYVNRDADQGFYKKVAVLPFTNVSGNVLAAARVTRGFVTEMIIADVYQVVEPEILLEPLAVMGVDPDAQGRYPSDKVKDVATKLGVQGVIQGAVTEYEMQRRGEDDVRCWASTSRCSTSRPGTWCGGCIGSGVAPPAAGGGRRRAHAGPAHAERLPGGGRRSARAGAAMSARARLRTAIALGSLLASAALMACWCLLPARAGATPATKAPPAGTALVALLPFTNLSGTPEAAQTYDQLMFAGLARRGPVVESGIVDAVMDSLRQRPTAALSAEQMRAFGQVQRGCRGSTTPAASTRPTRASPSTPSAADWPPIPRTAEGIGGPSMEPYSGYILLSSDRRVPA